MRKQAVLTLSFLVILISSWSAASVNAASVNYTIQDGKVSVRLGLQFFQNATTVPALNGTFTGQPAQELTSALEQGIKNRDGSVSVSSVSGEMTSGKGWINSSIQFDVTGISSRKGGLLSFNCSWIPFNVTRDLRLGNVSYNLIGVTYVKPAFQKYVDFASPPLNETIAGVTYMSGGEEVPPIVATNAAGNATLLDFGKIASHFDSWNRRYNVTDGLTEWTYNPDTAVNLTMTVSPRQGTVFANRALYKYNATVSMNGVAQAQGDTIRIDVSGSQEPLLMLAVVIVTLVVAVIASWSYRSRRRQLPRRRK